MNPDDSLTTIAEIAITLAGFTGLIAVFRSAKAWTSQELSRLGTIIAACFVCLVTALLPFGLAQFSTSGVVVWGIPLALFGLLHLWIIAYLLAAARARRFRPSSALSRVILTVDALIAAVLVLSPTGLILAPSQGLLILVCIWGLVFPAIGFFLTLGMVVRGEASNT